MSYTLKAVAIDDEPIALDIIRIHAGDIASIEIQANFTNTDDALQYLQANTVDLLFIDIDMPGISGIDFVSKLSSKPLIIFITAYAEYAVKGFELNAVDYLLKPFSFERFNDACSKAWELHHHRIKDKNNFIFLKTGYDQLKVDIDDINYLESAGNYINFVLKDRSVLARMTFSEFEDFLPKSHFVRVHRRFVVAVKKVDHIERTQLKIGGINIPISATYYSNLTNSSSIKPVKNNS